MRDKNQKAILQKDQVKEEQILQSYDCKMACRVCPFPGAKCNKKDLGNVKNIFE